MTSRLLVVVADGLRFGIPLADVERTLRAVAVTTLVDETLPRPGTHRGGGRA